MKQQKSSENHLHTKAQKVAILFTDIKGSTTIWEKRGDVEARQLVERHNRLLFPIVKKFRGRVVKTIGDAIMAKFRSPHNAVKAAVAMQQLLDVERSKSDFPISIRIGIHYGKGLVEANDVYGDLVNAAARIESKAKANQILLSGAVRKAIGKKGSLKFQSEKSFVPKGKSKAVPLYSCDWKKSPNLINSIGTPLTVGTKQARRQILYFITILFALYLLFEHYIRFFIADSQKGALFFVDPGKAFLENGFPIAGIILAVILILKFTLSKGITPVAIMRVLKGGFIAAVTTAAILGTAHLTKETAALKHLSHRVYESKHLFVKVVANRVNVRLKAQNGAVIRQASKGDIFLLAGTVKKRGITYNRVWLGDRLYGYLPRVMPPKIGVPEMRLSYTNKFYITRWDLIASAGAVIAFVLGILLFRIRPV